MRSVKTQRRQSLETTPPGRQSGGGRRQVAVREDRLGLAWQDRIAAVASEYGDRASFFAVNPNNAETHPGDSFGAMKERVAAEGGWPLPYLRDESQEVARAYDAKTTPDVFVFDSGGTLRYRGAPDADHRDPSLNAEWLREALDAVLAGEEPGRAETKPVGCSVKWKA